MPIQIHLFASKNINFPQIKNGNFEVSGFSRSVQALALLECYAQYVCCRLLTFRENL
jgi:hypothetical protein